jgi:hypothetical protein
MLTLITIGDSVLDCGSYNAAGITPGQLLLRNDDRRFPEFQGQDLLALGPARLDHRAVDGARVADLPAQIPGLQIDERAIAALSIGGNDLLTGMVTGTLPDVHNFERQLDSFLDQLPIRPVLVATIYDPTFGDDARAFMQVDPTAVRAVHRDFNAVLAKAAAVAGMLIDLHGHFLTGSGEWFTATIEPSLIGASEIRRCFWPAVKDFAIAQHRATHTA